MGGVSEPTEQVLLARAYLSRVAEPTCVPLWAAVRERGPVAVAAAQSKSWSEGLLYSCRRIVHIISTPASAAPSQHNHHHLGIPLSAP